jgi:hypothetical protein
METEIVIDGTNMHFISAPRISSKMATIDEFVLKNIGL